VSFLRFALGCSLAPETCDTITGVGYGARPPERVAPVARTLLATLTFLSVLTLCSVVAGQSNRPKRVLILLENDASWPVYRQIEENVRATLRSGFPVGIQIFGEHMDRVFLGDPLLQAQQAAWIQKKYTNTGLDLVIGVGDVPIDLFPGVPLVFLGYDARHGLPGRPTPATPVARIWLALDAQRNLEAALRLQPSARQVVVIGGSSPPDHSLMEQVRDQLSRSASKLPITYWTDIPFAELCQRLAALQPDSIVLLVSFVRDGAGNNFISAEVVPKIAASSGAPVYVFLDTHAGSGAVGGYVTSFAEVGKQAGVMGLRMLAGEHPADAEARNVYLYDWRQLQRWGLSAEKLPPGSMLVDMPPTIWELYKWRMIGGAGLFLIQALLMVGLLGQQARRRKVEASLLERLTFEHLLFELSKTFTNLADEQVGANIEKSLGRIGEFLRIERITLHEFSPNGTELMVTFFWRAQGVRPVPAAVKADQLSWWTNLILRGEVVLASDLNALPEEASAEREYLRKIDTISVATLPLKAGRELLGCISFASTKRRVLWTEDLVEQLTMLAEVFSNALMRKRSQDARFRHAAVVESSDDAIISKDLDGIILSWNTGAQRLFGFNEEEAVGQSITILIPPELPDEEDTILQRLRNGESIEHFETVRVTKGGKRVDVSLTISPLRDSAGRLVGASRIARDITDRKQAERDLRESEERFRLVANTAPVLIWMSGTDKLCTFFNQGWLNFTGQTMDHELGEGWASGVHPDDLPHCLRVYSESFDARTDFELEYRLRRFDGEYRWVVDYGAPRFESDGTFRGYIGSCIDITERKSSEAALHELSGRLIHAQEEERARIARELHDDFSQRLALLGIGLGQLLKRLPETDKEGRGQVQEMWARTNEVSSDVHRLSHQLHSSRLELVGLVSALNGLCGEIGPKNGITVVFADLGAPSTIPKDVALCLFRIAQEALTNVVKHSSAKQAHVEVSSANGEINLRITDEGLGFDPARSNTTGGIGLVGMRERLRLVGGRLSVKSEPMRGTEILAEVPLSAFANDAQVRTQSARG